MTKQHNATEQIQHRSSQMFYAFAYHCTLTYKRSFKAALMEDVDLMRHLCEKMLSGPAYDLD